MPLSRRAVEHQRLMSTLTDVGRVQFLYSVVSSPTTLKSRKMPDNNPPIPSLNACLKTRAELASDVGLQLQVARQNLGKYSTLCTHATSSEKYNSSIDSAPDQ